MSEYLQGIQALIMENGLNLLGNLALALLILVVGRWFSGVIANWTKKLLNKAKIEQSLIPFLANLVQYVILLFAIIAALERLGVETTSFVALFGGAALAIGLALQGALSNFAAGFLVLMFRPFKVGDFIESGGEFGQVKEIQVFNTILITLDNKTVIIPNSHITGGNIINYSKEGKIRLDLVFGIGYGDDLLKAKKVLEEIVVSDDRVFKDPAPTVDVLELGDSSVNFAVRPYVTVEDYWGVHFAMHEKVKLRFDEEGISIPFPQRDVHLFQQK